MRVYVLMCVCMSECRRMCMCVWAENNFQESVLSCLHGFWGLPPRPSGPGLLRNMSPLLAESSCWPWPQLYRRSFWTNVRVFLMAPLRSCPLFLLYICPKAAEISISLFVCFLNIFFARSTNSSSLNSLPSSPRTWTQCRLRRSPKWMVLQLSSPKSLFPSHPQERSPMSFRIRSFKFTPY